MTDSDTLFDEPDNQDSDTLFGDNLGFYSVNTINRFIRDITIVIWTILMFVKLIIDFYCTSKAQRMAYKPLQYAALIAVGFVFIGYSLSLIEIFTLNTVRYWFYVSLNIGFAASYLFILLQLYYSFRSSIYGMTECVFYLHLILCLSSEIFFVLWAILDFINIHPWKLYAASLAGIFFLMGILHIVYSFNRNLFLVIVSQRRSIHSQANMDLNRMTSIFEVQTELNQRQLTVLQMIVKHTVLGSFEIGCYISLCFIAIAMALIDPARKYDVGSMVRMWCLVITIVIVTICMYLSFAMNNRLYYVICGKCDSLCRKMCEGLAIRKIDQTNKQCVNGAYVQLL